MGSEKFPPLNVCLREPIFAGGMTGRGALSTGRSSAEAGRRRTSRFGAAGTREQTFVPAAPHGSSLSQAAHFSTGMPAQSVRCLSVYPFANQIAPN